jgi:hypothetical protein
VDFLQGAPEREICKAVRVKPKLQQRPQDIVDVKSMDDLHSKDSGM